MAYADRFALAEGLKYHFGDADGFELGTPEASNLIHNGLWVYDRQAAVVIECRANHEMLCYLIWIAYKDLPFKGIDTEPFLKEHMGFWMSSVAYNRTVYVDKTFCLTAQEKMAFAGINFKKI